MGTIQFNARFPNIAPDDLDAFERRAKAAIDGVKDDPGILRYEWFLSADGTGCVARALYHDSDALLDHLDDLADRLEPVAELGGGMEIEILGDPSPELVEATDRFDATVYRPFH